MFQVPVRFGVQSTLFGSVVGGEFVSAMLARIDSRGWRMRIGGIFLAIASILSIGMPSLLYEVSRDLGMRYPKDMNWVEARKLAKVIEDNHLSGKIVCDYDGDTAPALAMYEPVKLQRGHWLEVHPSYDPANDIPAREKIYVIYGPRPVARARYAHDGTMGAVTYTACLMGIIERPWPRWIIRALGSPDHPDGLEGP
jgi:hypothetical protein